ncbi:hypothetical protein LX32DRAFT_382102 [Colletotrichum zoysiae]|uniref:Uncharacterized protein n=1 Tax=Colletotrichum zoysiae TaxID=1216348 RepID=A0AAD9HJ08_9PEZI|nr:hypothetical protein LX32DRAFT_382102 [Colletotrichum zoysiae]
MECQTNCLGSSLLGKLKPPLHIAPDQQPPSLIATTTFPQLPPVSLQHAAILPFCRFRGTAAVLPGLAPSQPCLVRATANRPNSSTLALPTAENLTDAMHHVQQRAYQASIRCSITSSDGNHDDHGFLPLHCLPRTEYRYWPNWHVVSRCLLVSIASYKVCYLGIRIVPSSRSRPFLAECTLGASSIIALARVPCLAPYQR